MPIAAINGVHPFLRPSDVRSTVLPLVVRKLAQVLPNAETRTFFGAGHVPHLSYPREYVEAVKTFARV